jgi:hypothetical protein
MSNTLVQPYVVDSTGSYTLGNVIVTGNVAVAGTATLGPIDNVKITGGVAGQTLITDGTGNLSFTSTGTAARAVGYNLVFGG